MLARREFASCAATSNRGRGERPGPAQALMNRAPTCIFECAIPTRGRPCDRVAHEVARATEPDTRAPCRKRQIPVNDPFQRRYGELLGFDPLYLACEGTHRRGGRARERGRPALAALRTVAPQARSVQIRREPRGCRSRAPLRATRSAGSAPLDELEEDPLPRIC